MAKKISFEDQQVIYAQMSMKEMVAKGYTHNQAAQIHLDSLRFISAIKSMRQALHIVCRAAELNGMKIDIVA